MGGVGRGAWRAWVTQFSLEKKKNKTERENKNVRPAAFWSFGHCLAPKDRAAVDLELSILSE